MPWTLWSLGATLTPLDLDWRIAGIPCRVRLTTYERGTDGCIEYDVLDSRGRPAPWLERKVSDEDRAAITADLRELLESEVES